MPSSARRTTHAALYLDTPEAVERFLVSAARAPAIALDTEGASFHRFVDRIYLMQVSTREATAVIDPLPIGKPATLRALLETPRVEKVFHDADYDLRLLHQDYGWHARGIFDTRIAAQLLGIRSFGLAALLEQHFGVKLDKKHQRADWSMRPLPADMLDYAAQDTMYLLELRDRLRAELERKGRWSWAEEEFRRLEGLRWEDDEDGDGYLRIKGTRDLTRRQLAIFRELVQWRDAVARQLDRATFRVAANDALLEIARAAPASLAALSAMRSIPRGLVERRSSELLAAVRRGLAVSEAELPKFPRAARYERDPDFDDNTARLKRARDAAAHRLDMDPGFLCSRDRLEAIARRKPRTLEELAEVTELRAWQRETLGEEMVRALRK